MSRLTPSPTLSTDRLPDSRSVTETSVNRVAALLSHSLSRAPYVEFKASLHDIERRSLAAVFHLNRPG